FPREIRRSIRRCAIARVGARSPPGFWAVSHYFTATLRWEAILRKIFLQNQDSTRTYDGDCAIGQSDRRGQYEFLFGGCKGRKDNSRESGRLHRTQGIR